MRSSSSAASCSTSCQPASSRSATSDCSPTAIGVRRSPFAGSVFVPIKTDDQLDLQALHRVRDRWVARRTAVMNQIRGFLMERGITVRKGPSHLATHLNEVLEDAEIPMSAK